jgi:Glycosyl transferase family 2
LPLSLRSRRAETGEKRQERLEQRNAAVRYRGFHQEASAAVALDQSLSETSTERRPPLVQVSTIIPAYNAETTIVEALDSVLSQSFQNHEVVVVNDGSNDSTAAILAGYGNRIRVIYQTNGGVAKARHAGVVASSGKYLAFLDADDMWLPAKLTTMVAALEQNPQASLAFSDFVIIDGHGAECGSSFYSMLHVQRLASEPFLVFSLGILPSVWMIPRAIFERTDGFLEQLDQFKGPGGYLDQWMLLLLREFGEFVYVPEKLSVYRAPKSQESADKYAPNLAIFIALAKRHYGRNSRALIRMARNKQCKSILSKVAHQMDNRDRLGAVCSLARIAGTRPAYFFSSEFTERLFLPHNIKRARSLAAILNRTHE